MNDKERAAITDAIDSLKEAISRLTWANLFWGRGRVISLSRARYALQKTLGKKVRINGLCSLASSYYAAFGSALADARLFWQSTPALSTPGLSLLMVFRSVWCLGKALRLALRFYWAKPVKDMSSGQLDILASIFRTIRLHRAALSCVSEALERPDIPDDDRVLLLIHWGEIEDTKGRTYTSEGLYDRAEYLIVNSPNIKPTTHVRFLRSLARYQHRMGGVTETEGVSTAWATLAKALRLALDNNLESQVTKIRAQLRKIHN